MDFSSLWEKVTKKAEKKKKAKYGQIGKASKGYREAQEELDKDYSKDKQVASADE